MVCQLSNQGRVTLIILNMKLSYKVLGLALAAAVGVASTTFADDAGARGGRKSLESRIAELEAKLKDAGAGGVKGSGIKISGYVDTSYLINLSDRDISGPVAGSAVANTGRVFDNQFDAFNLNAVKLTIEKDKDTSKFPAGFRIDTIYGEDAHVINGNFQQNAAVAGENELAIEQAYVNLGIPLGNGIDIKVGKMVTLIGYEVIESPANWQFSRSDAFRLSPLTQTGVTAGYKWTDWLTSTVGVINGVDSGLGAATIVGSGNRNTDFSFIGRLDSSLPKTSFGEFNLFVAGLVGNDQVALGTSITPIAVATTSNSETLSIFNLGLGWNKPFGVAPLGLGVEYLYRNDTIGAGGTLPTTTLDANALSIYGKYDWSKWTTTSARFGYSWYGNSTQRNAAGVITGQESLAALAVPAAGGFLPARTDLYSFTLTQAFNVWKDTLVRLEWRRDWVDGSAAGFGAAGVASRDDIRPTQDTIAVNVVYSF